MIFWHIVVLGTTNESAVLSYANLSNLDPNFLIPGPKKVLRYIMFEAKTCKILLLLPSLLWVYFSRAIMSLGSLILALFS